MKPTADHGVESTERLDDLAEEKSQREMKIKRDIERFGVKKTRKMNGIEFRHPRAGKILKDSKNRIYIIMPDGSHRRVKDYETLR